VTNQPNLRHCPSCGGEVTEALGLRDYASWLTGLPGKVSASDLDFVLEQAQTGRVLIHEYKEGNKPLGVGQRLLLQDMVRKGCDVWLVWEGKGTVTAGAMTAEGKVPFTQEMTRAELSARVVDWWYDGLR
jgi:hypothetical protein